MSEMTRILSSIDAGDPTAAEKLLPLVYHELRKLAAARLAQEKQGQTLQALVHEAYLRLVGGGEGGRDLGLGDEGRGKEPRTEEPKPTLEQPRAFFCGGGGGDLVDAKLSVQPKRVKRRRVHSVADGLSMVGDHLSRWCHGRETSAWS
jgi:hypothetical protein